MLLLQKQYVTQT